MRQLGEAMQPGWSRLARRGLAVGVLAGALVMLGFTTWSGAASRSTALATSAPNPFAGARLYVESSSPARRQVESWRRSRPADAAQVEKIASQSQAQWFGDWNRDVHGDVARVVAAASQAGAVPVLVAYNIPSRDCGSYSAGGARGAEGYRRWMRGFADGLRGAAVVILEPDALAGMSCLSGPARAERTSLLREAVQVLRARGAAVYLDAGHARWVGEAEMGARLREAGIEGAAGFALNVSNYHSTSANLAYGTRLSSRVGGKHFVIDTSRNGAGAPSGGEWCNPPDRALGANPTARTGHALVDAFLWIKRPGESDGTCNGGPRAGQWWPEYALGLAQRQPAELALR